MKRLTTTSVLSICSLLLWSPITKAQATTYTAPTNMDVSNTILRPSTGNVTRTLSDHFSDTLNVKDFGAKCDGNTDDTKALQNAINTSSSMGHPLQIEGVCTTGSLNVPTGLFIKGSLGAIVKLISGAGSWLFNISNTASDVTITNLTLDGTNLPTDTQSGLIYRGDNSISTVSGKAIHITNNRFINIPTSTKAYTHAVMLYGVDGGYVSGNQVDQSGGDALNFNTGYYFVTNNSVSHTGDGCIAFNNSARGTISGNVLSYCHLGVGAGPEGKQSDTDIAQNLSIVGNTFESDFIGVNLGWFTYSGRSGPTNWQITANTFRDIESVGVEFDGASNTLLTSGVVANNSFYGTGSNNFDGSYQSAPVDIRIGLANVISITGNTISSPKSTGSNQSGIQLIASRYYTISGNTISDPSASHYARGIATENSQYGVISGNTINSVSYGIVGEGGLGLSYTSVSGNSLIGILNTGIASGDLTGNTTINNNLISGSSSTSGIVIPNKSHSFSIVGNVIDVAGGVAIVDNAANWGAATIRSNTTGAGSAPAEQTNVTGGDWTN